MKVQWQRLRVCKKSAKFEYLRIFNFCYSTTSFERPFKVIIAQVSNVAPCHFFKVFVAVNITRMYVLNLQLMDSSPLLNIQNTPILRANFNTIYLTTLIQTKTVPYRDQNMSIQSSAKWTTMVRDKYMRSYSRLTEPLTSKITQLR